MVRLVIWDAHYYVTVHAVMKMYVIMTVLVAPPSCGTFHPRWSRYRFNTLRPRQNGRHFADDIFKRIFWNENIWISIDISLNFIDKGQINNIPALVQIMAWRRPGDKSLSEPMMVNMLTHICVTRPQWVKSFEMTVFMSLKVSVCLSYVVSN